MWIGISCPLELRSSINWRAYSGQWRKAFLSCRKHRIDLNFLVEHSPDGFFSDLPKFVEQIDDVDYINLFLTSIGCVDLCVGV